jgi:hypothetical protein
MLDLECPIDEKKQPPLAMPLLLDDICNSRQEVVEFGKQLQELKSLDHVCEDHVF